MFKMRVFAFKKFEKLFLSFQNSYFTMSCISVCSWHKHKTKRKRKSNNLTKIKERESKEYEKQSNEKNRIINDFNAIDS